MNYPLFSISSEINLLPKVRKVTLMKLPHCKNNSLKNLQSALDSLTLLSLGEVLKILPDELTLDLLNGVYSDQVHSQIRLYVVYQIEYDEYDGIRGSISEEKMINLLERDLHGINTFRLERGDYEYEIVPYNYELMMELPRNIYKEPKHSSIYKSLYPEENSALNAIFEDNCSANFAVVTGDKQCGINGHIREMADENGSYFFKKNFSDFESENQVSNYLKKREFTSPNVIMFKSVTGESFNKYVLQSQEVKEILKKKSPGIKNNIVFFHFVQEDEALEAQRLNPAFVKYHSLKLEEKISLVTTQNKLLAADNVYLSQNLQNLLKKKHQENEEVFQFSHASFTPKTKKNLLNLSLKEVKYSLLQMYYTLANEEGGRDLTSIFSSLLAATHQAKVENSQTLVNVATIPEVKWSDIGGLSAIKEEIYSIINLPKEYPNLFKPLPSKNGLLLHGPPGTGKTLIAKAIANESSMNFISIKGPELLNMYIGESEKNVKRVFQTARKNSPCVLFFDEIDSLCPRKSSSSDQDKVTDRVVSQFMIEMDAVDLKDNILVIGATNRIDLIEPGLLRRGRFDKAIYLGLPESREEKEKIFEVYIRKMKDFVGEDLQTKEIVELFPKDYSGADISEVCSKAFTCGFKRFVEEKEKKAEEVFLRINKDDFVYAIGETRCSNASKKK